jgi:hypothetical protein
VFNDRVNTLLSERLDGQPDLQTQLSNGGAYALASKDFMESLGSAKTTVLSIYVDAMKRTWQVAMGFASLGFVVACVIKQVAMREALETEFGLEEKKGQGDKGVEKAGKGVENTTEISD